MTLVGKTLSHVQELTICSGHSVRSASLLFVADYVETFQPRRMRTVPIEIETYLCLYATLDSVSPNAIYEVDTFNVVET